MGSDKPGTVVLVHGGFVDGSGWQGVYDLLKKDGYDVAIVQNPTLSLEDDTRSSPESETNLAEKTDLGWCLLACVLGEDHEVALAVGRDDLGVTAIARDPSVAVDGRDPREADSLTPQIGVRVLS